MKIFSHEPFGYEGQIVEIQSKIQDEERRFSDVAGIAEISIKSALFKINEVMRNSGIIPPEGKMFITVNPIDLRKEGIDFEFPMALSVALNQENINSDENEKILAVGKIKDDGTVLSPRNVISAVKKAEENGITNVICNSESAKVLEETSNMFSNVKVAVADTFDDAIEACKDLSRFKEITKKENSLEVTFRDDIDESVIKNLPVLKENHAELRALEIAVAGKHNVMLCGHEESSSERKQILNDVLQFLTPKLTQEENSEIARIKMIYGSYDSDKRNVAPFSSPRPSASISDMCGSLSLKPGFTSLSHNGTLFLEQGEKFSITALTSINIALNNRAMTISGASRSVKYPADFQLALSCNTCHQNFNCINNHVEIKSDVKSDKSGKKKFDVDKAKERIKNAYEIQRKRGIYNRNLSDEDLKKYCKLSKESETFFKEKASELNQYDSKNMLKLALTIANMEGRERIKSKDLKEAYNLSLPLAEKSRQVSLENKRKVKQDYERLM